MRYRAEIDGLRAVAVIPVILFHAGFSPFSGGFVGVDVFFVISGYLITTIIIDEVEQEKFSIVNFYERRARRILPALYLVLLASLPFAWFWLPPQEMMSFSKSLVAVSVFASNVLWQTNGYFDTDAELKPLHHTWSLAVEEQYYVIFPIFLMFAWRLGKRRIMLLLAGVGVLSLAVAQWASAARPDSAFYLLPTRVWELLIGVFLAFYISNQKAFTLHKSLRNAGGLIGTLLLGYSIFAFDKATPFPSLYTLAPTLGAALIILCTNQQTLIGWILGNKILVGIGLISYSAYLWHQPLLAFARHRSFTQPSQLMLLALSLSTIVLAYFSWKYVEAPFRDKKKIPRKYIFIFSFLGSIAFIFIGFVGSVDGYTKIRFGMEGELLSDKLLSEVYPKINCIQDFYDVDLKPCIVGTKNSPKMIVAIGDSHMGQWADVLNTLGSEKKISIRIYSKAACASSNLLYFYETLKRDYWECKTWRDKLFAEVDKIDPKIVFLTTSSAGYVRFDGKFPSLEDWKVGVSDFVEKLANKERRIVWLIDNPRFLDFNPLTCFTQFYWHSGNGFGGCVTERKRAFNRAIAGAEIDALSRIDSTSIVDFTDFYCNDRFCKSIASGVPLMRDNNHLSRAATFMLKDTLSPYLD